MPPKSLPNVYQLLLKTQKLTIFLSAAQTATIRSLKVDALDALASNLTEPDEVPSVKSIDDFEICRELRDKGQSSGYYEALSSKDIVKNKLAPWEVIYLQFRDEEGELRPVEFTLPPLLDEDPDEIEPAPPRRAIEPEHASPPANESEKSWGKRKARPD